MKYWKYVLEEDGGGIGYAVITEAEILKQFFSEWKQQMEEMGREDEINEQNCIEEWITYYSAWQ